MKTHRCTCKCMCTYPLIHAFVHVFYTSLGIISIICTTFCCYWSVRQQDSVWYKTSKCRLCFATNTSKNFKHMGVLIVAHLKIILARHNENIIPNAITPPPSTNKTNDLPTRLHWLCSPKICPFILTAPGSLSSKTLQFCWD